MTLGRGFSCAATLVTITAFAMGLWSAVAGAQQSVALDDLNRRVEELYHAGEYRQAIGLAKRALTLAEHRYGPNHADAAVPLSNLALLSQRLGNYAEAESLYRRALAIDERTLGAEDPHVAIRLNNLAQVYRALGSYAKAEPLMKRALAIAEKALGPEDVDRASYASNLAELYQEEGQYAEAEPLYQRSLTLRQKVLGPDHPDIANSLGNLASLYQAQNRFDDAEPLIKRALAIDEKALGPDHPSVGTDVNNLAALYRAQGRYGEAEPLYLRSLAIRERRLGRAHPEVGDPLDNLAGLYSDEGRYVEAEALFRRSLSIREKGLGRDNPVVAKSLNELALLYRRQGRDRDAEPLYQRALAMAEKALGPNHPEIAAHLGNLAGLYRDEGREAEAEALFRRAIAIDEKSLGQENLQVGTDLNNLAELYDSEERYTDAEPLYQHALAIAEKTLGPDHPDIATHLHNLAVLYRHEERYGDAEPLYQRGLSIREKVFGADHPDVANSLSALADVFAVQGRFAEAESNLQRALAIDEKALPSDHPRISADLDNLAVLHSWQKDWAGAVDYGQRSVNITIRRARRGTRVVGKATTGKATGEAKRQSGQFWRLVKAVNRLPSVARNDPALQRETFQTAQWAQSSQAAESLAEMAARGAKGDAKLTVLVRERQDLVAEWQKRDVDRSAAVSLEPQKRDVKSETTNSARLAAIDARIAAIDKKLAVDFPDYAALASPTPLSVEDVQAQLGANEALVLFLDTPDTKSTPEETFIWAVTKTDVRWVRSDLGRAMLTDHVTALRCGLDYNTWTAAGSRCRAFVNVDYTYRDYQAAQPLPFDLARAHALYKALFGGIEDLIKDKQLLVVPSGPLTQLPFQVLVTALSSEVPTGERQHDVNFLGADFEELTAYARESLKLPRGRGVRIVAPVPQSPAEAAGLRPDDILLSIDGKDVASVDNTVDVIRAHTPHSQITLRVLRAGSQLTVSAILGRTTAPEWIPRLLGNGEGQSIAWLARAQAITVLPAVSSLKALRELSKESHATEPYVGFGDPLLDGEPERFKEDGPAAKLAREKRCEPTPDQRAASLRGVRGGTRAMSRGNASTADVANIRRWAPLPETADELCDVAHDLGVDAATHVYLGAAATESKIKQLSEAGALAKNRIVHFATHGAVAGEISNATEPGLLLTPPDKASETDDGYLSASDIAGLKLDADWVILSACNTAAGDAKGAESLSGLARAFFYAGARSLLVSHWEVASEPTVKLITKAVDELKRDPKIGRAEALRRSMVSMIDAGRNHEAHPAYWAPFVLVGEGGAAR